jgi:hypothetical protein
MDPLSVVGWGLVYMAIGSVVAKVVYLFLHIPACRYDEDMLLAFWAMLLWPVVVGVVTICLLLAPLAPLGRALVASWEWWLED